MTEAVLIFVIGFLMSAFFSGAEMAFVSCNKLKVHHLAREGNADARTIEELLGRPKRVLASILLYNNFANVTLTAAFAYVLERKLDITNPWTEALLLTPFLIIFAELVPKEYFHQHANRLIFSLALPLKWVIRIIAPGVEAVMSVTDRIIQKIEPVDVKKSPFVTLSELRAVIHESAKKGLVLEHEKRLIDKIFEFEKKSVEEIMQPLTMVQKVPAGSSVKDLKAIARKSHRSSFWALVYEQTPSHVIGVIHVFDTLFEEDENQPIQRFVRTPLYVRTHTSNEEAFFLLQRKRQTIAVVLDKQDRALGIITVKGLIQF